MPISFAIPFYSTPEYLDAAVRSVLAQTTPDWELVVVDDQSPHRSIERQLADYGDKRIRYVLNEKNLGQSGNWNRCLEVARSDLVTILHADDMLLPNYGQLMLDAAVRNSSSAMIFCRAEIVDGSGRTIFSFADFYKRFLMPSSRQPFAISGEDGLISLSRGNFIMAPTVCYRKSALGDIRFSPDWRCAPDLEFTSRVLLNNLQLVGLPEVAFQYRRHEDSGTANYRKSAQQFEEEVRLYDLIATRADEKGWARAAAKCRSKTIVKLRLGYFAFKDLLQLRFAGFANKFGMATKLLMSSH